MDNGEITTSSSDINLNDEFTLSSNDYMVLSNILLYNAINLYKKEFKLNKVPATFIKFYIYEISGYDYLFDEKLNLYFKKVSNKNNRISVMMNMFAKSFPEYVKNVGEKDYVFYIEINPKIKISKKILESSHNNKYLKSSIDSLKEAIKHYNNNDELRNVEYIFKDYLYNTYTADALFDEYDNQDQQQNLENNEDEIAKLANQKNLDQIAMNKIKETSNEARHKKAALLTGRQIEIPKQKGKVVSVIFPVLPLPSAYPILREQSRINSNKRIKHLMSPSSQITLINKYYFNQIKYSLDFINKRKVIEHDLKKSDAFNFDF